MLRPGARVPARRCLALALAGTAALLALSTAARAVTFHTNDPDRGAGDVLQILLPATGLAMAVYRDDREGEKQWAYSTGSMLVATQALKLSFNHTAWGERPNGGQMSFPSGHTAGACSGAFFIGRRYGWQYGGPALAPAALVAYSRVDEGLHHWRDVLAGCALAGGIAWYFVTPEQHAVTVLPDLLDHGFALQFSMDL